MIPFSFDPGHMCSGVGTAQLSRHGHHHRYCIRLFHHALMVLVLLSGVLDCIFGVHTLNVNIFMLPGHRIALERGTLIMRLPRAPPVTTTVGVSAHI
jgi:hypothetical protein